MEITLEPPYLIIKPDLSEDDFYRLADEDADWEYLDGGVLMHSPASHRHEDVQGFLLTLLRAFVRERGLGVVVGSRYPMRLDAQWSPEPDILFVRENRRHLVTAKCLEGPADMVVEIVSESDPGLDYREKLPRYRAAGIEEIWIVDPFRRQVLVESKQGAAYTAKAVSSGFVESPVLPGFRLEASWLWETELPSELRCLRQMLEPG